MRFKSFKTVKICLMIKTKFFSKKIFVLFQSTQHFYGKGKYPDPHPDPYLWLTDPDPGGPKTSGSGTLIFSPYRYRYRVPTFYSSFSAWGDFLWINITTQNLATKEDFKNDCYTFLRSNNYSPICVQYYSSRQSAFWKLHNKEPVEWWSSAICTNFWLLLHC